LVGSSDIDRWATAFAPAIEFADPRTVGLGSVHGAEASLRAMRALAELTDDWAARIDDVLGLRSDALLVRRTDSGTLRTGGGAYERQLLVLWVFGTDGLLTRWEQFDAERDVEVLARFDELTAEPSVARPATTPARRAERHGRRVRSNAATASAARFNAAMAARDADALATQYADEF